MNKDDYILMGSKIQLAVRNNLNEQSNLRKSFEVKQLEVEQAQWYKSDNLNFVIDHHGENIILVSHSPFLVPVFELSSHLLNEIFTLDDYSNHFSLIFKKHEENYLEKFDFCKYPGIFLKRTDVTVLPCFNPSMSFEGFVVFETIGLMVGKNLKALTHEETLKLKESK